MDKQAFLKWLEQGRDLAIKFKEKEMADEDQRIIDEIKKGTFDKKG